MAFHVGQKVVCIEADGHYGNWRKIDDDMHGLTTGAIYTVRDVGEYRGLPALWLAEIIRPMFPGLEHFGECGYSQQRFRPVVERKTDISIFTEMLKPKQRELVGCGND